MNEIVTSGEDVCLAELMEEYGRCALSGDMLERMQAIDATLECRWPGQSKDGRKWDVNFGNGKALPWDGCSDTRVNLADEIVADERMVLVTAFQRAMLKAVPVEASDVDSSTAASKYIDWLVNTKLARELGTEVETLAHYFACYPWAALQVTWRREMVWRRRRVTMDAIVEMARQNPQSLIGQAPAMLADPARTEEAIQVMLMAFPDLKKAQAAKGIKELRERGETFVPYATVGANQPCFVALKPVQDLIVPDGTIDIQQCKCVFRRLVMSEAELRSKVLTDGWDEQWVEEAIKTKGKLTYRRDGSSAIIPWTQAERDLIEVIWGYCKKVDDDGIVQVWQTIFSLGVTGSNKNLVAKHELIDYAHGKYPFVLFRRERLDRAIDRGRGIPEIVATWQSEIKEQRDMLFNRSHWDTLPPIIVPKIMGASYKFGPAAQVQETRTGAIRFMDSPGRAPVVAMELIKAIQNSADQYFGRFAPEVPPEKAQMKLAEKIAKWFAGWSEAFQQAFELIAQYGDVAEFARVTGVTAEISPEALGEAAQYDFMLKFDARQLSNEFMLQVLDIVASKVLSIDATGVIDRAKLVRWIMRSIDPTLSNELVADQAGASQAVFEGVRNELAQMFLGNAPALVEKDPTAAMKLQFMGQVLQGNPKYQQELATNDRFRELMETYQKNLMMSVKQEQNKMVGRLGVQQQ
jgi:hypothetical protein